MSKETLTQKWAVASFFGDLENGYEFAMEETPLHATLAGVFAISKNGDDIAHLLEQYLTAFSPCTITGSAEEKWGDRLFVTTLKDSEPLRRLYMGIQDCLLGSGATFNEPQYLHDGFTPHVTNQTAGKLAVGESVNITRVSLVDMFPNRDGYRRRIHTTIYLKDMNEA